jgi:hypothetical protein
MGPVTHDLDPFKAQRGDAIQRLSDRKVDIGVGAVTKNHNSSTPSAALIQKSALYPVRRLVRVCGDGRTRKNILPHRDGVCQAQNSA